jgi:glycosyltransferase involved in cell wall biosynthesis
LLLPDQPKLTSLNLITQPARLRLLMVTPRYLPDIGGVENHVHQVAPRIANLGIDVTVLTTRPAVPTPDDEWIDGVHIRRVTACPKSGDYYFAPAMYPLIAHGDWDLMHLQSYHTLVAPLAMWAAMRARIPYVVTFHGGGHSSIWRTAVRGGQRTLLRPLLARAERLIVLTHFERELFSALPAERFVLIPNGADLPPIDPPRVDPGLIVSIGRLEKYKGHQRILAALPNILAHRPDAHLWIAGAGPFKAHLEKLARKLGVSDQVEIRAVPASARQQMATELARAALVVLLSEYETQPLGILEAIALGRPALVADTTGLHEIAAQGLARAIPVNSSPQAIAWAVLHSLNHPSTPKSLALPTWDECAAKLVALYQTIARSNQCAS